MSTFKKAKVERLPTNEKSLNSVFSLRSDKPYLMSEQNSPFKARIYDTKDLYHTYFNLYIISDDEIKEGDWCLFNELEVVKCTYSKNGEFLFSGSLTSSSNHHFSYFKKIITTTDTSLQWLDESEINPELARPNGLWKCLPQPSQQFIEKYIEEYNKGNIITDVLVEYETLKTTANNKHFGEGHIYSITNKLKINHKDNTITIKKLKDSWNKEEIIKLIKSFANNYQYASNDIGYNKWIEENL